MINRKIRKIMKEYLHREAHESYDAAAIEKPEHLKEPHSKKKRYSPAPRWAIALASVAATFIFMLTPPGQAVSDFVYNVDVQWNEDKSVLEINYNVDTAYLPQPEENYEYGHWEFTSPEEMRKAFPDLPILKYDHYDEFIGNVSKDLHSAFISNVYKINDSAILIGQTIHYTPTASTSRTELSGDAVPIEATFNNGKITATGGYENGYASLLAYDQNCEYSFIFDKMTQEQIFEFFENCHF